MKWFGVLKFASHLGGFNGVAALDLPKMAERFFGSVASPAAEKVPFERKILERYYAQVLLQYTVSFWSSLVFAVVGFILIGIAAFMHYNADAGSAVARFIAGAGSDAVATLFFVQSRRTQQLMREFFDKLRRERGHAEARELCESVGSPEGRDALRIFLALHFAEVENADGCARSINDGVRRKPEPTRKGRATRRQRGAADQ